MQIDILLLSVDSPILLGIYKDNRLIDSIKKEGKIGEILPCVFREILRDYDVRKIFYANGPGNFSAIKLTHIFLQTLHIAKGIRLFCADSFNFTNAKYINAYGKIHFYKDAKEIKSLALESKIDNCFTLPKSIDTAIFDSKCEPLYILPAVQL